MGQEEIRREQAAWLLEDPPHSVPTAGPRPGCPPTTPPPPATLPWALTVVADRASVGSHGAVTGEAIPLLQADALVGTGLFGAGGAGAWKSGRKEHPPLSQAPSLPRRRGRCRARPEVPLSALPDWKGQILPGSCGADRCSGTTRPGLEL